MLTRLQQCRDQDVDSGVFCAHVISRALNVRGFASPIERLFVAGRQRLVPPVLDHVEVETEPALIELNRIDRAHRRLDPRALQIARERQRDPLLIAGRHQNFEGEGRFGRTLPQHGAIEIVACLR